MTASDILNIVVTVAGCQAVADLLSNYLVFNGDAYKETLAGMDRAEAKLKRAEQEAAKNQKHAKRLQFAKDDYSNACSLVAAKHASPSLYVSLFFVLLLRILGTEHNGKVIAILPFVPYDLVTRVSARGLPWSKFDPMQLASMMEGLSVDYKQGVSFFVIYMLTALSVKYYVSKLLAVSPPAGADGGLSSIANSPAVKSFSKSMGFPTED
eukprot:Nitzschia sp. Nitz4//scaffold13_size275219//145103//145732//NITZ4_000879-RA/size275219-processed-gene-0.90-mRNA-1//1//CDS//3329536029//2458//frame0